MSIAEAAPSGGGRRLRRRLCIRLPLRSSRSPGPLLSAPGSQVEELVPAAVPVDGDPFTAKLEGEGEDPQDVVDRRLVGEVHGLGDAVVGEPLESRLDSDVLGGRDLHRRDEQVPQIVGDAADAREITLPRHLSHFGFADAPLPRYPLEEGACHHHLVSDEVPGEGEAEEGLDPGARPGDDADRSRRGDGGDGGVPHGVVVEAALFEQRE